jgi:hypothetical protein
MTATSNDNGLLIGGSREAAQDGALIDVRDPATGAVITQVPDGGAADVDRAVEAAEQAFEFDAWSVLSPAARARLLWNVADVMDAHADELAAWDPRPRAAVGRGAARRSPWNDLYTELKNVLIVLPEAASSNQRGA